MCGIVGLVSQKDWKYYQQMNSQIIHRGPDDEGKYVDEKKGVALAMRRLSIVDLESGHQPMYNEDDSILIVCNGEIFNSPSLRSKLVRLGHQFRTTNSDIETILHLYEEKGFELMRDLIGMYAFVIYDKKREIIFGARDPIGIKPLYFSKKNGCFAFASELKCFHPLPWISKDINQTSLYHYLSTQFVPAPGTIFSDIDKLPAGHFFVYDLRKQSLTVRKYWELNVTNHKNHTRDQWKVSIRKKLQHAFDLSTLSDVPIACSLSGGLDSSAIVGALSQSGFSDLITYSVGFEGKDKQGLDELPLARKVAQKWKTRHREIVVNPRQLIDELDSMVYFLDEPYGGGLPSWFVYREMSKEVKVILTGSGGDELFGNYGKFNMFNRGLFYPYLKMAKDISKTMSLKPIVNGLKYPKGNLYPRYFSDAVKESLLYAKRPVIEQSTEALFEQTWRSAHTKNPMDAVPYVDFKHQLPEEFLFVTDRFSMAHSVEARVPYLDHTLVEQIFSIPASIRTNPSDPKAFLKETIKDLLPNELINAPKKGFVLPLQNWIGNELRPLIEDCFSPSFLSQQGIFSKHLYKKLIRPQMNGKRDYSQQVWTVFMFQLWYKKFVSS